ncbi:hypothetical protein AB3N61_04605 [Leptospira sp. WS58.C1]|uniref:hypothetical protein n=1 Tax=Leptospira cinconiae TaxID=3235173 RepID=UPI00349EB1DB
MYNTYEFCSTTATFSVDKTFWGAFRWIVAPEFSQNVIRTYDYPNGTSKRTQDYQADLINGYHDISTKGYKFSYGAGLRIIWNQATVILIDYAKSREDSQLFIDIGQIF